MLSEAGVVLHEPLRPGQCLVVVGELENAPVRVVSNAVLVENLYFKRTDRSSCAGVQAHNTAYVLNCTFDGGEMTPQDLRVTGTDTYLEGAEAALSDCAQY
jgi:hypothetical protein